MKKVLLSLFSLLTFYACDPCGQKLILINNTEDAIYYQFLFSDTLPYFQAKFDLHKYFDLLSPYDTVKPCLIGSENTWVYRINKEGIDSALHIFIFPTDQVTDELIKNREYVRLSYKVKELDSLNWTVVYRGCGIF